MYIVHVFIHVKKDHIETFRAATLENVKNSLRETGVARFDFIQQSDDPARFVLVEVYRTGEDSVRHKETSHYLKWRDTVADMMEEPRTALKFVNIHPNDKGWD